MVLGKELFFALFNNLAIFIALVAVYGYLVGRREGADSFTQQGVFGLTFGLFAIGCMYVRIPVHEGVIVDQRNAIVALSGAFGGPLSALVSAAMTGAYRVYLGGGGALAGAVGVGLAAVAGVGLHRFHGRMDLLWQKAFGAFLATLVILPGFLLVGDLRTGWSLLKAMALPYGIAIFLGVFLVGLLLEHEEHRQEAKDALRKSENLLNTILSNVGAYIFVKDTDYRYTYVNSKVCELCGRDERDILGRDDTDFLSAESVEEITKSDRQVLEKGESVAREEEGLSGPDGLSRTYWTVKLPLRDERGQIYALCGISTDITARKRMETERRQLEATLQHSQKMEAIGTLSGGIAHDFNNILSAILGYTELTLTNKDLPDRARKHLGEVVSAAGRARELVKQILMFSRKDEERKEPIPLGPIVEEAVALLRQTLPATIEIRSDTAADSNFVLADATRVHQIVMNLGTNAFHAMRETGGLLEVRLETVLVDQAAADRVPDLRPGEFSKLTVRDTGVGMDPVTLTRIFDPFFTTKGPGEGTGMGLSVVHGIIRGCGGAVGVDSRLGAGTTFTVFLPSVQGQDPETGTVVQVPQGGEEHVLVVDDDPALVALEKELLESLGYRVTVAGSPQEALDVFAATPDSFDLLLTDQTMPRMTGDMLARQVMRIRPGFPVIICTGYSEVLDRGKAQAMGIRALLMKPLDRSTLSSTIRGALDGSG